MALLQRTADE
jgi:hypothetical protein